MQHSKVEPKPLGGLVWIDCPYPLANIGLARVLQREARVHVGREPPTGEKPSLIIFCSNDVEGLAEGIRRVRQTNTEAPVVVFGLHLDVPLALVALRAGARGFVHMGMQPKQILRALKVAAQGEMVAPRKLLEYLMESEYLKNLDALSARQREILELTCEGLTNAQIAQRVFLTESTVKQHLRAAYKLLGVRNRTEAARLFRQRD